MHIFRLKKKPELKTVTVEEDTTHDAQGSQESAHKQQSASDVKGRPKPRECPEILEKKIVFKKRTHEDCKDCMRFINTYGKHLEQEVIQKRIDNCNRHHRMDENPLLTPEGFWDISIGSIPDDDRRKEVFVDYRLVNKK